MHLFWIFDHSGIFGILQDAEPNTAQAGSLVQSCMEILQQKLQESITDEDWGSGNDVQRADVFLTRQWMRAILSRAAFKLGIQSPTVNPVNIAREFLSLVSRIPPAALESHGATLVRCRNNHPSKEKKRKIHGMLICFYCLLGIQNL